MMMMMPKYIYDLARPKRKSKIKEQKRKRKTLLSLKKYTQKEEEEEKKSNNVTYHAHAIWRYCQTCLKAALHFCIILMSTLRSFPWLAKASAKVSV